MVKIKIRRYGLVETLVYIMFLLMPFTLLINTVIFNNFRIAGIGVINLVYDATLIVAFFDSLLFPKKYRNVNHMYLFILFFIVLHLLKFVQSDNSFSNIISWFSVNQYYYLLPYVYIMLKNKKLDLDKIAKGLVFESYFICAFSVFMFLTSNYFGMTTEYYLLKYDVVGTPFARMFSVFGSPLVAGSYFALILIILVYCFDTRKINTKILLVLNGACLVLTFSRAGFIAFFVVLIYKYLSNKKMSEIKKVFSIIMTIVLVVLIIMITSNNGFYFWKQDIFHNARIEKWSAGLQVIKKMWFLGSDFTTYVMSFNSWETTLSDNSFLLSIAYYGIVFWLIIGLLESSRWFKKPKNEIKAVMPAIIGGGILLFLYDFLQMFPVNYILMFVYVYLDKQYIEGKWNSASAN